MPVTLLFVLLTFYYNFLPDDVYHKSAFFA